MGKGGRAGDDEALAGYTGLKVDFPDSRLPGGPEGSLRMKALAGLVAVHAMAAAAIMFRDVWWQEGEVIQVQCLLQVFVGISATGGAHRLFVHQAYEATLPLQLFYAVFIFASLTGSPIAWIKTHRTHHEHSDTALDPHNSHKGFWHSHFGWTLWEPSTAIKRERLFQKTNFLEYEWAHMLMEKIYEPLGAFITLLLPVLGLRAMGIAFADINYLAVFLTTWIRLCVGLNMAASVNSLAHTFGERHHNPNIEARNNFFVSLFTWGEGWHNYHHAFPKDFRASSKDNFVLYWNPTHAFILLCAYLGLAYNLKQGCSKSDADVSIGTFHYKYRFPNDVCAAGTRMRARVRCAALRVKSTPRDKLLLVQTPTS